MKNFISKEEISALPVRQYEGPVHIVDSDDKVKEAAQSLAKEKVLGFDTETRPAFKIGESYPPSILQLASEDGVYIFLLARITHHKEIAAILADRKVRKAGISVRDDIKKLKDVVPFKHAGFIELARLSARAGIKNAGIRGLAALLFGFRISKGCRVTRWDAHILTQAQIAYAATDAWMAREIYFALRHLLTGKNVQR